MLDCLKRNDDVDGVVRQRNLLSGTWPGVKPILASSMKADGFGDVHSNYMISAGSFKCRGAIALTARNIQDSFLSYEPTREGIPVNMLPERKQVGALGYHAFIGGLKNQ